jgi:CheY-like chemotaxis protein
MYAEKLTVLCVDDEIRVLQALERLMRDRYRVLTAPGGAAGVDLLNRDPSISIVLSDMRMPEMDGAQFLSKAQAVRPSAIRILLTGHADTDAAIRAINEGQIFRFITKPCTPDRLKQVLEDAQRQYELVMAEKTLLQRTLLGCIKALVDTISFASPAAVGRTVRLKRRVSAVAAELELERSWEVEAAALFSELGTLSLSQEVLDKVDSASPLSETEHAKVREAIRAANELVAHVPRLGPVSRLLNFAGGFEPRAGADAVERAHLELLELSTELDNLELAGSTPAEAVATVAAGKRYSARLLDAAQRCAEHEARALERSEVGFVGLRVGMVLAEDVRNARGVLLAARGSEVTVSFLEKMGNFARRSEGVKFAVLVPRSAHSKAGPHP